MAGCTVATSVVAGALVYYLNEYCDDGFRGERFIEHLRGSRMRNWHYVDSKVRRRNAKTNRERRKSGLENIEPIMVGKVPMPLHLEDRNTMICASIGAGKSVTMESMMASALKRNDKMAVVDPNGTFYSKFSFKGDVILNPFDARSAGWTVFNEIRVFTTSTVWRNPSSRRRWIQVMNSGARMPVTYWPTPCVSSRKPTTRTRTRW